MGKNDRTKSVFLYGKPTKIKAMHLTQTQQEYTHLINNFIEELASDKKYFLDIFNNNKKSPQVRLLEKNKRVFHPLGSAYGQNAIDHAMKEIHNHFIRIRNHLYGVVQNNSPDLLPYVSFFSLLNASIMDQDELGVIDTLLKNTLAKKKTDEDIIEAYKKVYNFLSLLTEEQRSSNRSYVRSLFYEKLDYWKLPFVKKATIQLDTRVSKIEKSHSTKENFVVSIKLLNETKWQAFPVSTSRTGLRRLSQYKNGSMTATFVKGKVKIGIPITKKVKKQKQNELLGIDSGIVDLFHTSTKNKYGTFSGMIQKYEQAIEKKLGNRSSLRNKRKAYQKRLKKTTNPYEKKWLREKIKNISDNLNNQKTIQKKRRSYAHMADFEISQASKELFEEVSNNQYLPVFEDLDIVTFDRGKKANKRDSFWVRGKLMQKVTEKLKWHGYDYKTVDPAYTSKVCQKCFNVDNDNRKGKRFTCTVCKYTADADHNAAVNIRDRAFDIEIIEVVEKYRHNTKKRHKAIIELLYLRHCSYMKSVS